MAKIIIEIDTDNSKNDIYGVIENLENSISEFLEDNDLEVPNYIETKIN